MVERNVLIQISWEKKRREKGKRQQKKKTTLFIIANPFCRKSPSEISVFYRLILIFRKRNGKGRLGVDEGRERICLFLGNKQKN